MMNSKKQKGGSSAAKRSLKGGSAAKRSLKGGSAAKKGLKGGSSCNNKRVLKGGSEMDSDNSNSSMMESEPMATKAPSNNSNNMSMKGGASKGRQLYCLKCKTKVAAKNVTEMSKKTKIRTVKMAKGVCPKCGTKVFGIIGGGSH
jgi:hypothetical protein